MISVKGLSNEEIERAYLELPKDERVKIDDLALKFEKAIKARSRVKTPITFGRKQSLEVLTKTGIWLIGS